MDIGDFAGKPGRNRVGWYKQKYDDEFVAAKVGVYFILLVQSPSAVLSQVWDVSVIPISTPSPNYLF